MADVNEVIVVGSGAGGGMMAHTLTEAGVNVLLLEAGRRYDAETDAAMFQLPKEAPLRGEGTPDKNDGYFDANIGGFEMPGQPYTLSGDKFRWWRSRQLGGRTHHFGRQVPRYGPEDFKVKTVTGREIDWPFSYEDIEPYYDRVETIMGLFGPDPDEAVYNSPQSPNHIRQEPPAPRASEMLFAKACEKMGIKTMAHPTAILTSPLNGREACFYATNCIRGCSIGAAFDSVTAYIKPAEETGKLSIITGAVAYKVLTDISGKSATGIRYIDTETGEHREVFAKFVVLAPGSMESARILLNSKSEKAPDGLANSSGMVGKYISDTMFTSLWIHIPELDYAPPHNEDGVSQPHIYAVGDVTDRIQLTPVAIQEGHALADMLFNKDTRTTDYSNVPSAVFSTPPIATVGLTEDEARAEYGKVDVYDSNFKPLVHTLSGRDERAVMKLIVDPKSDVVVGCHMMGLDAPEIIQGVAIAMKCGATKAQFDATTGIHPSSAEEFVTMRSKRPDPEEV